MNLMETQSKENIYLEDIFLVIIINLLKAKAINWYKHNTEPYEEQNHDCQESMNFAFCLVELIP